MSVRPTPDLAITAWLDEEAREGAPERLLDATRRQLEHTNQRRVVWPAWRLTPMTMRIAVVAAAIVLAVGAGYLLLPKSNGPGATLSPSPTATLPRPAWHEGPLVTGQYSVHPFMTTAPTLLVTLTVPEGWSGFGNWGLIGPKGTTAPDGTGIGLLSASSLYRDGCHWDTAGTGDPRTPATDYTIGNTAKDLAEMLHYVYDLSSTPPMEVTVGGYSGRAMDIEFPSDVDFGATCDPALGAQEGAFLVWSTPEANSNDLYVQGPGNRWHLSILDVEDKRVIVVVTDYAGTSDADRAAAQEIVDSIEITP